MEKQTISFKSIRENFNKELHGIKCCTIRKIEIEDERFIKLFSMEKNKDYGIIEINCESSCFKRQIKDITCWDGWMVISWDNPDLIKKFIELQNVKIDERLTWIANHLRCNFTGENLKALCIDIRKDLNKEVKQEAMQSEARHSSQA